MHNFSSCKSTLVNSNGDFSTSLYYKGNKEITWETSHSFNTGFDTDSSYGTNHLGTSSYHYLANHS